MTDNFEKWRDNKCVFWPTLADFQYQYQFTGKPHVPNCHEKCNSSARIVNQFLNSLSGMIKKY